MGGLQPPRANLGERQARARHPNTVERRRVGVQRDDIRAETRRNRTRRVVGFYQRGQFPQFVCARTVGGFKRPPFPVSTSLVPLKHGQERPFALLVVRPEA